ncbi:MAG: hypothetical protein LBK60_03820 [Verrucomicrobiales bacterium]|jgi:hypothetical protein|nr:hypothetical protein [Verrucomicrobiales bacterium]
MKRQSALVFAVCWFAVTVSAEETTSDPVPVLELPALELPSGHDDIPDLSPSLFESNSALPPPPRRRPRPAVSGSVQDKNWLVNGLLDFQKKQLEEKNAQKQKQLEAGDQLIQQELERQQKVLQTLPANPLDSAKFSNLILGGTNTNSGTAAPVPVTGTFNLPNGRLSLSGSNVPRNIAAMLTDLPELPGQYHFLNSGTQPASDFNPVLPRDPVLPAPSVLPQWSSNPVVVPKTAPPVNLSGAIPNLTPAVPASVFNRPLTFTPSASPLPSNPNAAANVPRFNSTQAADFLKQQDKAKAAANPNRPPVKNMSNSIPNPSDMRRF